MKKLVIGIDVSKMTLDISIYNGNIHKNRTIKNTESAMRTFLKKYSSKKPRVVMESTGIYHLKVALEAHRLGYRVSVVNPFIIKRFADMKMMRAKTDRVDARIIATYGYEQNPKEFIPKSKERMVLCQLLKSIEDLYLSRVEFRNRLESYKNGYPVSREVGKSYNSIVSKLNAELKRLKNELKDYLKEHFSQRYAKLEKICGVGLMTSSTIIAYYGKFENFDSAKKAVSFAGLNPNPKESGTSVKRGSRISKKGHAIIRKMLYMGALSAKRYNPQCKKMYDRLLAAGKHKKVALIAVAHKLLRQIYAVIKYDREWDPNYVNNLTI